MDNFVDNLKSVVEKYEELQKKSMDPQIVSNVEESIKISKELKELEELYKLSKKYLEYYQNLQEAKEILDIESDKDLLEMAKEQKKEAEENMAVLEEKIKIAMLPKDPNDDKNIFLEIRPAAGGEEASLFAAELLKMYLGYADKKGWKTEIIEEQLSDLGGIKLVVVKISGDKVYSYLKFESGVHRVQRIPVTESQGRVHTSTVTVAILPEVDDVEIEIKPDEIEIDTYAASSAGGQHANKNETGVRIHHKPTGIIVNVGDSRSQMQNKEKAMRILKAKLYQMQLEKQQNEIKENRLNQVGTGDRSEKIRTYNFPQDRVTDHRIKKSWSNLPEILKGEIDDIINSLIMENQKKLLEENSNLS